MAKGRDSLEAPRTTKVRRGPRFTHEDREATEHRILDAAIELLRKRGLGALSFHSVAAWPGLKVTRTAPLHYFGSRLGLLGAIADRGFRELTNRLSDIRQRASSKSGTSLVKLALAYAEYALQNPNLYRAIHEAHLWRSISHSLRGHAASEEERWIGRAVKSRDEAFHVFVEAVEKDQAVGILRKADAALAARVVTSLVDGYLFQVLEEYVDADQPVAKHLRYLKDLVDLSLQGLAVSSSFSG